MKPKELILKWVRLFNEAKAEEIALLYHPEAVNHQVANQPVIGQDKIRKMFREEFDAFDMTCIVENVFEDGEWGILEWKDPHGLRGCGFFHVVKGKILFQRGYWDRLSFLKQQGVPLPNSDTGK